MTLGSSVGVRTPRETRNPRSSTWVTWGFAGALGGIRTPNLLIRSQMLYPLSYERLDNDEQEYTRGALAGQSSPAPRSGDPPEPLEGPLGRRREHCPQEAETSWRMLAKSYPPAPATPRRTGWRRS